MKPKETINLYRVISLLVIALVTFGVMGGLCAKSHLYPDEWLSMFFLTLIFLLACMFELELMVIMLLPQLSIQYRG